MNNGDGNGTQTLPQTIAIIYSEVKREYFPTEAQYLTEKDALSDAKEMAGVVEKLGIRTKLYPGDGTLAEALRKDQPDLAINLVGSVKGSEYLASTIPAVLELLQIPYTGADMLGESLNYNKFLIKKLLQQTGLPVPNYQLFNTHRDPLDPTLRFPLISKLNEIHGGVEITKDAVSENDKHLRDRLRFLITTYEQPVLVEEFIVGREITGYLMAGLNKKVYFGEKIFRDDTSKYTFLTFEDQWAEPGWDAYHYQRYQDPILKEYVKRAFEVTKMSNYGKFDVRLDGSGRYYFLDANSNPYISPSDEFSDLKYILNLCKVPYTDVLKRLILNAQREWEGKKLLPYPSEETNNTN